jgi:hypothetical protein
MNLRIPTMSIYVLLLQQCFSPFLSPSLPKAGTPKVILLVHSTPHTWKTSEAGKIDKLLLNYCKGNEFVENWYIYIYIYTHTRTHIKERASLHCKIFAACGKWEIIHNPNGTVYFTHMRLMQEVQLKTERRHMTSNGLIFTHIIELVPP